MKCCIYCRVSTSEQELENQLLVLTEWAEQRDFQVVKVYQEEESAWRALFTLV
jgi:DNA invertase Pin-like site-specific DNA recombinase